MSVLPPTETYKELGSILVSQQSTSELVTTSLEKQIEEARKQACRWGADAIILVSSESSSGLDYSVWSGLKHNETKSNRIVAIRFNDPSKNTYKTVNTTVSK